MSSNHYYSPGCAQLLYKPEQADRLWELLSKETGTLPQHQVCCQHQPGLPEGSRIINTCPGCDKRFRSLYSGIDTVSLWEILADSASFPFPDYQGQRMTIHDACPTRDQERVLDAVRKLAERMRITLVEPDKTRRNGSCCGDSFYGKIPKEQLLAQMTRRATEMPCEDVIVYCVSCIKSMHLGGKKPRYLVDLLLGTKTEPGDCDPDRWHGELRRFIAEH